MVAQFMSATGWSCENGQALLAAHDWQLQAALAEVLGTDVSAQHASLERAARQSRHSHESLDRDLATALASSMGSEEEALHEQRQLLLLQEQQRRLERREQAGWDSLAEPAAAPVAAKPAHLSDEVRAFLEGAGLAAFADSFAANGYDEMAIIQLMGNEEMEEVGLKGGHKLKLREALRRAAEVQRGGGAGAAASAPGRHPAAAAPAAAAEAPALGRRPPATAPAATAEAAASAMSRPAASRPTVPSGDEAPLAETAQPGAAPSLGPWPDEAPAGAPPPAEEPQRSRPASAAAAGGVGARGVLDGLLRGPAAAKSQQRRYIKDGKITYVDE